MWQLLGNSGRDWRLFLERKKKLSIDITLSETQGAFPGMASVSTKEMSETAFGYCKQVC